MDLNFGSPKFSNISYFVQKGTIKGVQAIYKNEVFGITWDVDLSILLEIERKNGEIFPYTFNIRVNFSKDHQGNIIGWGSAFKISRLFEKLDITGKLSPEGVIPDEYLNKLLEKDICVLFYRTGIKDDGNTKFQAWDVVDVDRDSLLEEFDYAQTKGYPRNYVPHLDEMEVVKDIPTNGKSKTQDIF